MSWLYGFVTEADFPGFGFPSRICSQCANIPWKFLDCPDGFEQNSLSHGGGDPKFAEINSGGGMSNHPYGFPVNGLAGIKMQVTAGSNGCGVCRLIWNILKRQLGHEPPTMWEDPRTGEQRHRICYLKMEKYGYFFADRRGERKQMIRRATIHVETPCQGLGDNTGTSVYDVHFAIQPKDQRMPTLTEICNDGGSELRSFLRGFTGRERPAMVDVRCLTWWKRKCDEDHECTKKQLAVEFDQTHFRVIDVQRECLVPAPCIRNLSYVALSYVWGCVTKLLLSKDNIMDLMEPGSITADRLPKTIADAMELCDRMGQRYLWCDQICIQQDNDLDMMEQVSRMHLIYSQATFTIIASGLNADSGLPGLNSERPKQLETTVFIRTRPLSEGDSDEEEIAGENAADAFKPLTLLGTLSSQKDNFDHYLANEPWYGRGWTMQERVLSGRNLIFSNEQVYWECKEGSYCEESWFDFWQPRFIRQSREPSLLPPEDVKQSGMSRRLEMERRQEAGSNEIDEPIDPIVAMQSKIWSTKVSYGEFFGHYKHLVMRYSQRTFTKESDVFFGFMGITAGLTERTSERFIWGIPLSGFESFLLWFGYSGPMRPVKADVPIAYAETNNGVDKEDASDKVAFKKMEIPSWSWMAWRGPVQSLMFAPHPQIHCYTWTPAAMTLLNTSVNIHCPRNGDVDTLRMRPWRPNSRTEVTLDDIATHYSDFKMPADRTVDSVLFFWASSARFRMKWSGDPFTHGIPGIEDTITGESAGVAMQCNLEWWRDRQFEGAEYEFVLIATMENADELETNKGEDVSVQVMQIEWKDGLARRLNVGGMKETEWMRAKPEWKLIALA